MTWLFSVLAAIVLFLHGLAAFSDEVTRLGGERLRDTLRRITRTDWHGALTGAAVTAVVQSSSAVTSMAVGLAHNRTLSGRGALAVMIGAHVGTTLTAWLVAFKIAGLGPIFVSIGGLWSLFGPRPWRAYGKPLFYFGLIFLSLDLIAQGLAPIAGHPQISQWQSTLDSPVLALLFGMVLTAIVQSSSVVSGLAVLAVSQGLVTPQLAVWVVAGANVGTTSTALLASSALDDHARKLALLNTGCNVFGVLLFALVVQPVLPLILGSGLPVGEQVALVHTLFNVSASLALLLLLPWMWPVLARWLGRPLST